MFRTVFLSLLLCHLFTFLYAQELSEIQNVKVDNLSNSQIGQLINRYQNQGLSQDQMLKYATERGMPAAEVQKLKSRIDNYKQDGSLEKTIKDSSSNSRRVQTERSASNPEEMENTRLDGVLSSKQEKIYGYRLFHRDEANFNPELNIPTPSTYILGRGDQLLIEIYGASQQSYDLSINPDGKIFVPSIGSIEVGGLSVSAATARIKSRLSVIYSGMTTSPPNTFMELRLGNIKTVSISLVGEVNFPGNYTLPSFASPLHALFAGGGPTTNGTFRYVQVFRQNKLLAEVDIYEFLNKGIFTTSIMLQDDDVVIVPPARTKVEIEGPVRRSGIFELKNGETFMNLLELTGGFKSTAFQENVTVTRTTKNELRVEDVNHFDFSTFYPQDGDYYRVSEILNRYENRVQVSGAVNRPGVFSLDEGMTIKDLIKKASGLRNDAFQQRVTLYRTKDDFSLEIIAVDLQAINNQDLEDIQLKKEDVLNVPSIYELKEEYYVKISGEVNNPGAFPYGENLTVEDLVLRSGGLKASANNRGIEVARRIKDDQSGKLAEIFIVDISHDLAIKNDNPTFILQPFDHVIIKKSPGFQREKLVRIEGEAIYPGEFTISHTNERISDIIKRAGGLNPYAYPKGATLIRRNEFYKEPLEEEINMQILSNVKENMITLEENWTEFDKIYHTSINKKIARSSKNIPSQQTDLSSEDFRQENINTIGEKSNQEEEGFTIRDTELIGINLDNILKNPYSLDDLILKEGDIISIPKELQTVRMRGEILYPTSTRYKPMLRYKNYISKSGGFTEKARRGRSFIIYANGDVKRTKKILFLNFYPPVEPGAELIVPRKPERIPLTVQGWIGLGTSLATLAIIVNNLID
jgi:protein involved in polysaccharide export with SLBB domain